MIDFNKEQTKWMQEISGQLQESGIEYSFYILKKFSTIRKNNLPYFSISSEEEVSLTMNEVNIQGIREFDFCDTALQIDNGGTVLFEIPYESIYDFSIENTGGLRSWD